MNNIYLTHHGIKGQKWGVRRYQNEDGSLTEAGKKKYTVDDKGQLTKKPMSEGKKTALKVGVGIAGAAAITIGTTYLASKFAEKSINDIFDKGKTNKLGEMFVESLLKFAYK